MPGQVLPRHCSLVKTVRDPPSTTRVASSVFCLTNGHLVGRITDSRFYNNSLVCARRHSRCVPDSVRASLACSNNLRAAPSSSSTEDIGVIVLARDSMHRSSHSLGPDQPTSRSQFRHDLVFMEPVNIPQPQMKDPRAAEPP